jgi:hypothetical protein
MPWKIFLACRLYPLAANFKLGEVTEGVTLALKLKAPLPKFRFVQSDEEDDVNFRRGWSLKLRTS